MRQVSVPEGADGAWEVSRFEIDAKAAEHDRLMADIAGFQGRRVMPVPEGSYTKLTRNNYLVMTDTPSEMWDHMDPVRRATGSVLLAGLGLGMVLQAILDKDEVEHVTVIEKSPEVIRLVGPHYQCDRLAIIEADIFEWKPKRGQKFDAAWFDIWDDKCGDNLEGMSKLKRKFARRAKWKGCWSEGHVRSMQRRSR